MTIINYTSLAFRIQSILTVQVGFNWSSFQKYIPTMMHAQQCLQNTGCAYDLLNKYNLLPSTSFFQLHLKDHCNSFSSWRSNIRGMQTTFGQENVGYKFSIIYQKFYKLHITCIYMVAYLCHHLSDNYVDLSDLYVVLSDLYVDLSDLYVDLSLIHLLENNSCPINAIKMTTKLSDKST